MIKTTEDQKTINDLKKMNKTNIFIPIFYTVLFLLTILSTIVLSEEPLLNRLGPTFIAGFLSVLYWNLYFKDRRAVKEMTIIIDDIEKNIENKKNNDEYLSNEEKDFFQKKSKSLIVSNIEMLLSFAILSIYLLLLDVISLFNWIKITIAVLLAVISIFFLVTAIINGVTLKKFVDDLIDD